MVDDLIADGEQCRRNNEVENRQAMFRLCRKFTRDMCGILGARNRIPPPKCIENLIKTHFPNEDGSEFVGCNSD